MVKLRIRRHPHAEGIDAPRAASTGSAGLDLRAAIETEITLAPGQRRLVPTGFSLELPEGWEGQVRPRSGLAAGHGLTLLNSPGTIDSDYRGEVQVILVNLGQEPFTVRRGDRIAQLVIAAVAQVEIEEVEVLDETRRGAGGFGSTGVE